MQGRLDFIGSTEEPTADDGRRATDLSQKTNAVRASHPNRIHKREFCFCRSRALRQPRRFALQRFCSSGFRQRMTRPRTRRFRIHRARRLQSRKAGPFLRRPQRPGCPLRLHALGTASAIYLERSPQNLSALPETNSFHLPQNQPCTITGSATFTLAVMELSRILSSSAIGNCVLVVRKLWTLRLPCGKARKTRGEIVRRAHAASKKRNRGVRMHFSLCNLRPGSTLRM
jgi:hypothetical protein